MEGIRKKPLSESRNYTLKLFWETGFLILRKLVFSFIYIHVFCSVEVVLRAEAVEMAQAGDKCDFTGTLIVVPDVATLSTPGKYVFAIEIYRTLLLLFWSFHLFGRSNRLCLASCQFCLMQFSRIFRHLQNLLQSLEPRHGKTNVLHMRKQRCRSASR